MSSLRQKIDKLKPHFSKGGRFEKLQSVFDGFEAFMFVSDKVTFRGSHIRDSIDLKRTMSIVIIALLPACYSDLIIPACSISGHSVPTPQS